LYNLVLVSAQALAIGLEFGHFLPAPSTRLKGEKQNSQAAFAPLRCSAAAPLARLLLKLIS